MNKRKEENQKKIEEYAESKEALVHTNSGVDWEIEGLADQILAQARAGITKHSELRDYLSKSQLDLRWEREIYPTQGFPEKEFFSGMYSRAYNPNTRGNTSSKSTPSMMDEIDHD